MIRKAGRTFRPISGGISGVLEALQETEKAKDGFGVNPKTLRCTRGIVSGPRGFGWGGRGLGLGSWRPLGLAASESLGVGFSLAGSSLLRVNSIATALEPGKKIITLKEVYHKSNFST